MLTGSNLSSSLLTGLSLTDLFSASSSSICLICLICLTGPWIGCFMTDCPFSSCLAVAGIICCCLGEGNWLGGS